MTGAVFLLALIVLAVSIFTKRESELGVFDSIYMTDSGGPLVSNPDNIPYGQIALEYIVHMNDVFYDRFSYSFREMNTAVWLVNELLEMGYSQSDIKVQEFTYGSVRALYDIYIFMEFYTFMNRSPFVDLGFRPSMQSQNIVLTVPGQSEDVIVVGAHYDSVFFPGASDNASGVALLLESAQRMLSIDNYYTIEYVFFGAEEMGLFGSLYYVDNLTEAEHDNILFMINADILLDGDQLFYMAGYDNHGFQAENHITEAWDIIADDINVRLDLDLIPMPKGIYAPSDHLAFLIYGHTIMNLAGLDAETIPSGHISRIIFNMIRVTHSPRDNIHYINTTWPNKAERNMRQFSLFLEELLLTVYQDAAYQED